MNQVINEKLLIALVGPHITEKSASLESKNIYVFRVRSYVDKLTVKRAVETIFKVMVHSVRICNVMRKDKRKGRAGKKSTFGKRRDWKKAYVKLEEGQTINFS